MAAAPTDRQTAAAPSTSTLTDDQAAAWRDVAALGGEVLRLAGLDASGGGLASDHGIGSNNWVVAPSMSLDRRRAARQRPASRHLDAVDLVHQRPPLRDGRRRLPVRRGRRLRSRACRASCSGTTRASRGARPTSIRTSRTSSSRPSTRPTRPLPRSRRDVPAVRRPHRADPRVRRRIRDPRGPRDDPRPDPQRRRRAPDRRAADGAPLGGDVRRRRPRPHLEAILGLNTAANFEDFRASPRRSTAPRPRTSSTPTSTATSATSSRATCPIRSDPLDRGDRPVRGDDGGGRVDRPDPVRRPAVAPRPAGRLDRHRQQRGRRRRLPALHRRGMGPGLSRRADHRPASTATAQDGLTVQEMAPIQNDTAPLAPATSSRCSTRPLPATADGTAIADRIAAWDGACDVDSLGCAAYMAWEYRVLRDLFDDDLGPLARDYVGSPVSVGRAAAACSTTRRRAGGTTRPRRPAETARTSSSCARWTRPEPSCGPRSASPTAGRGAVSTPRPSGKRPSGRERHRAAGVVLQPGSACPRPARPVPSTPATSGSASRLSGPDRPGLRAGRHRPALRRDQPAELPADHRHARSRRRPDRSSPPASPGNPFDRHYDDQIEKWRTGETVPLPFTRDAVDAAAVATLTLSP